MLGLPSRARMGEIVLSANAILLNLLIVIGFFLENIAQAAEQLTGKAVGGNWRPVFDRAYGLSFLWDLSADVHPYALDYLPVAALCALTFSRPSSMTAS